MSFCRATHVWENPTLGTQPFVTGMWLQSDTDPNEPDLFALLVDLQNAYEEELLPLQAEQLGAGQIKGVWSSGSIVIEKTQAIEAPVGGGNIRNAGFSLRAILGATRPPGARNNSMYWPYIDTAWYGITGATQGGVESLIVDWADAVIDHLTGTPFQWVARHYIDNDDHVETFAPVTGATAANSVSFMQKRYR